MRIHRALMLFACAIFWAAPGCDQNPTAPTAPNRDDATKSAPAPEVVKGKTGSQTAKPLN